MGTVLKVCQILLAKTKEKDKPGTNTAIIEQEQKWGRKSADLLELEVDLVNTSSVFIDFQNLIDCSKAVLSGDWQTLNAIAKVSDNSTKKKLNMEEEKCATVGCCIRRYNKNTTWVHCRESTSLVHYLCEGIPSDTYFGDNASYEY